MTRKWSLLRWCKAVLIQKALRRSAASERLKSRIPMLLPLQASCDIVMRTLGMKEDQRRKRARSSTGNED